MLYSPCNAYTAAPTFLIFGKTIQCNKNLAILKNKHIK